MSLVLTVQCFTVVSLPDPHVEHGATGFKKIAEGYRTSSRSAKSVLMLSLNCTVQCVTHILVH